MTSLQSSNGIFVSDSNQIIDSPKFSYVTNKLRQFFLNKGFVEVHTQSRLSILAACEDPSTITTFTYNGETWPMPQTGQMWLEYEMLKNPENPGYFCVSTSYRNEPNPIPGRHDLIFPMFEFEIKGGIDELMVLEKEILNYLGYKINVGSADYPGDDYINLTNEYKSFLLEHEHEQKIYEKHGSAFFLQNFPSYTSPFWNMKSKEEDSRFSNKIDVILSGMETIGSAERSCNPDEMRESFNTISNGMYANTLYNHFGKERVDKELNEFLSFNFFKRSGGGIGITRLIKSLEKEGLLDNIENKTNMYTDKLLSKHNFMSYH